MAKALAALAFGALVLLWGGCANLNAAELANVKAEASRWANEMGLKPRGVTCTAHDSDLDGFVSCAVAAENGEVHPIECSWTWGGCRMVERIKVRR